MQRWRFAPHAAVALLAAALYLPTLRFGFVLDDKHLIVDNVFVRSDWSPLRAFAHHFWYGSTGGNLYYRPLVNASLALNGRVFGWDAAGFHLVNVLLHAVNAALVVALGRRLGAGRIGSLVAGMLMAVHPAASWAVGSIVARVDLLPAFFVLCAWIVSLPRAEPGFTTAASTGTDARPRWQRPVAVGVLFLAALLSKESAAAFLIVPLFALRPPAGAPALPARGRIASLLACVAALATAAGLRLAAGVGFPGGWRAMEPFLNPLAGVPFPDRLLGALRLTGRYLGYLVVPWRFTDPTDYTVAVPRDEWLFGTVAALAAAAILIGVLWRRRDPIAVPLGFAIAAFLPASNLLVPIASIYALNFLYLPLIGLSLTAGMAFGRAAPSLARPPRPALAAVAGGAAIVALALAAAHESALWRDEIALASAWTGRFPHYAFAHGSLGVAYMNAGDAAAALPPLRRSIAIDDRSAETRYNLGLALLVTARSDDGLDEALRTTRGALDLDPGSAPAHVNASQILLRLRRPAEAEAEARKALEAAPDLVVARLNLAEALVRQSRTTEADAEFDRLLRAAPDDPRLLASYVDFLIESGRGDRARAAAESARAEFPALGWFDFRLARLEAAAGRSDQALAFLRSAVTKDPAARAAIATTSEFAALGGRADFEELARP